MMRRGRLIDRKEVEVRVHSARTRDHKPIPWWLLARKRIGRVERASYGAEPRTFPHAPSCTREEAW